MIKHVMFMAIKNPPTKWKFVARKMFQVNATETLVRTMNRNFMRQHVVSPCYPQIVELSRIYAFMPCYVLQISPSHDFLSLRFDAPSRQHSSNTATNSHTYDQRWLSLAHLEPSSFSKSSSCLGFGCLADG